MRSLLFFLFLIMIHLVGFSQKPTIEEPKPLIDITKMIEVQNVEGFENKSLPAIYTKAALSHGWLEQDFQITEQTAHSGKSCLMVAGVAGKIAGSNASEFIQCSGIPLQANTTYRVLGYAKVENDSVKAYISANVYKLLAGEKKHIRQMKTNQVIQNRWQTIDLLFTTPDYASLMDLKFNAAGKSKAWFDDFTFEKLPKTEWTVSDTLMDGEKSLPFRMWIPSGTKHVSGIILATNVWAEEAFVINPAIRKAASEQNLAIIKTDGKAFAMFDPQKGEDVLFTRLLQKCAKDGGFPEIEFAPWLTFGHSTSGHFAKNLAYWKPERTFGILYFKSGQFHCPSWTLPGTSLQNIPILGISGQFEEYGPHGPHPLGESAEAQWRAVRDTFMVLRKLGYLVSLIVEPGEGHFCLSQNVADYMALFIRKAAQAKIPKNTFSTREPIKLNEIAETTGVLSDTCISNLITNPAFKISHLVQPYQKYANKPISFWHFDMEMAEAWIKFHTSKGEINAKK